MSDPFADGHPTPGHAWTTGSPSPDYQADTLPWWEALLERVFDALDQAPGCCLVYSSPDEIHEDLDCEGLDLLTLSRVGRLDVAANGHFLRVLHRRARPSTSDKACPAAPSRPEHIEGGHPMGPSTAGIRRGAKPLHLRTDFQGSDA